MKILRLKKLVTVISLILTSLLIMVSAIGCRLTNPVEVIYIFRAQPGFPPPPGGWGLKPTNPYPASIQQVFFTEDKMFFGLRLSKQLEAEVTFSRYTFFNKGTSKEVEIGSPNDLGPFEPGRMFLLAFNNPWSVPNQPGNYELRVYLDGRVVASALFAVK